MKLYLQNTTDYQEFLLLGLRLQENLQDERLYGGNEQIRHDRARIIQQLNRLALEHLHASFNDLCAGSSSLVGTNSEQGNQVTTNFGTNPDTTIFICSSHKDERFLTELNTHLKPFERIGRISSWNDTKISPGSQWQEEIQRALQSANTAILLVSSDFLASDFIMEHELPYLLQAAKSGYLTMLCVIVRPCAFYFSELADFQTVNPPSRPLSAMTQTERETVWLKIITLL